MLAAALISLGLHGTMLALPLGARGGPGLVPRETAALHATLRAAPAPVLPNHALAEALERDVAAAPAAPAKPADSIADANADEPQGALSVKATYFKASELTEIPRPLAEPPLAPLERLLAGEGAAHMTLFIDERGEVTAIDVRSTTLPANVAAQAAAIFSYVRFSPGRIGRFAVKSQIGVTVGAEAAAQSSYANRGSTALQ